MRRRLPTIFILMTVMIDAMGIGLILPLMPALILEVEGGSLARAALWGGVLSTAFAVMQFLFGPVMGNLSDRFGRRPVLIGGFLLYIAGSVVSLFVMSIEQLILARLLQAVGGGASVVLARAIVRDLFEGAEAGQMLAKMAAIMGLVPALAPMLGGVVQDFYGWKANFIAMALFGVVLLGIVATSLGETLPPARRQSAAPIAILRNYRRLLADMRFLKYLAVACVCFSGLFAFISGSSFVLQGRYGLSPVVYGLCFGAMAGGYVAGSLSGSRLVRRFGIDGTLRAGGFAAALGGLLMLGGLMSSVSALAIVMPIVIYGFAVGLTMPQAMAGALTPFPEMAGTASSLLGFLQAMAGAIAGIYVGHGVDAGAMPMVGTIAAMGVASFVITNAGRRTV